MGHMELKGTSTGTNRMEGGRRSCPHTRPILHLCANTPQVTFTTQEWPLLDDPSNCSVSFCEAQFWIVPFCYPRFKDGELQAKVGLNLNLAQEKRPDEDRNVIPQPPPRSCSLCPCAHQRGSSPAAALCQPVTCAKGRGMAHHR